MASGTKNLDQVGGSVGSYVDRNGAASPTKYFGQSQTFLVGDSACISEQVMIPPRKQGSERGLRTWFNGVAIDFDPGIVDAPLDGVMVDIRRDTLQARLCDE